MEHSTEQKNQDLNREKGVDKNSTPFITVNDQNKKLNTLKIQSHLILEINIQSENKDCLRKLEE